MKTFISILLLLPLLAAGERSAPAGSVLIEAERFEDHGGWVDDSQFMDQMGSPFLLAHGLGVPVADATTRVRFPAAGEYDVWVRTRDWVATWNAPGSPGRFQLIVNGSPLNTTFGAEGSKWHWQPGGRVTIGGGQAESGVSLAAHDLTGFEGRFDAVLFVPASQAFTPPDAGLALERLRAELNPAAAEIQDAGEFDLVVVGGGIAGTAASISAARGGLTVALIQDRPVLGGNNSSEVRVWLQGIRSTVPYHHIGDIVAELQHTTYAHEGPANTGEIYEDEKKIVIVRREKNIELRLLHRMNAVEMDGRRIKAVIAENTRTGVKYRFRGRLFLDSTGDACLGALAGADYEMSIPHMGRCNLWNVIETESPQPFPRTPWALDLAEQPFPGRSDLNTDAMGVWQWESGFDHDPIEMSEYIRDWNFRAAYGAWDALKNTDGKLPNHKLNWMAHISGKRESRRLLGDVILTRKDMEEGRVFEDGCVPVRWAFDVHFPDPRYDRAFKGDAFIATTTFDRYPAPFWIPYRCLYSRNIENMFMAGRDISVTHTALGAVRVMRTGGCMGEVVGLAASICIEKGATPRGVWKDHLDLFKAKLTKPVYSRIPELPVPPEWKGRVGDNVALTAEVTPSSVLNEIYSPVFINDGRDNFAGNAMRWCSKEEDTPWAELRLKEPRSVLALQVISGEMTGHHHEPIEDFEREGKMISRVEDFQLERHVDGRWQVVPGSVVTGNDKTAASVLFTPVEGERFRVVFTKTPDGMARIWEVALFTEP